MVVVSIKFDNGTRLFLKELLVDGNGRTVYAYVVFTSDKEHGDNQGDDKKSNDGYGGCENTASKAAGFFSTRPSSRISTTITVMLSAPPAVRAAETRLSAAFCGVMLGRQWTLSRRHCWKDRRNKE